MRFIKSKKGFALVTTLAVAAIAAVGAYAYFTSTGSGTGSGSVGVATETWTVTPGDAAGDPLYPGSGSEAIAGTVKNTSPGHVYLTQVKATIAAPDTTGSPSGDPLHPCSAADFNLDASTGWVVAGDGQSATYAVGSDLAHNGTAPWTALNFSMKNAAYNQDNCQGAAPKITFDAS